MIRNPILPGFNPDPSICRAGDEYFITTSTFEWYPGVQIHRSKDLVNWDLACRPLNRASQLDMRGNPDSCGIWAPCLSWADDLFWLVFIDVKRYDGSFKDAPNYIVTAPAIEGPWSDPVHVNSSGFDPSLFHDEDGRKWFVNLRWNHIASLPGAHAANPAFAPTTYQQAAGLSTYYNRYKFHFACVTALPHQGRSLMILSCPGDWPKGNLSTPGAPVPLGDGPVNLAVEVDHARQQFFWRQGGDWTPLGPTLDAAVISDEGGGLGEHGSFTGAFVGLAAFDTSCAARTADFTSFTYAPAGT